jgi:endonuclease/exonuclease/phosphatase family metal-dependent hydrolase
MSQRALRVGTFNLFNLVLPNTTYYDKSKYSPEEYGKKLVWGAAQLDRMRADVVGFQELFHQEALEAAIGKSDYLQGAAIAMGEPSEKGPGVALVSRFPIVEQTVFRDFPEAALLDIEEAKIPLTQFSRPVLAALIQVREDLQCTVVVVHLKSKRPILPDGADRDDPVEQAKGQARALIRRAAEATALRAILMQYLQNRNHPIIVLGDVNDGSLAVTTQILSGEPPWYRLPLEHRKLVWDTYLYQVKDIQARQGDGNSYYTHIHNGHYDALDQIMVSQEFVAQNPERLGRVEYVSVFNDHLIDETLSKEGTF